MVPINITVPSMPAAMWRLTGSPTDINVNPDEYKSRIAPPTNPKIAISANTARYQVGSRVVNAPIGSIPIDSDNFGSLPAKSAP